MRISVDLPEDLVEKLDRQAVLMDTPRQEIISFTLRGMMGEFEAIDRECGIGCPRCQSRTELDTFPDGVFRVCVKCPWRLKEVTNSYQQARSDPGISR